MSIPFKKKGLPEIGELVIAQIKKVFDYGAYANLLEYENLEAFIPWSEVSTKYVKDIKDLLKENQIAVGKVIRVEKKQGRIEVDISLKRVFEGEKRVKMLRWKRIQKAQKIIEMTAKNLGKTLNEAYKYVWAFLEKNIDPMTLIEEAVLKGPQRLIEIGINDVWAKALYEEAKKHVTIKIVRIRGIAKLVSYKANGIERIKSILSEIKSKFKKDNININIYTIGAPRYRIEIESHDYKIAEEIFNQIKAFLKESAHNIGIDLIEFEREELEKG
ncbi:MAG: translation initiation factor IF-2 subunit alpha [Ignisphaera sp.]|jgi:translation initiation factor 2 subunit 1|nr:translation initiation factor IF-2 subunit alpha [Ignisphaera sp.]MCC6055824.1 translation initiation factor IF-2 subunit alpha [Desulfurococcaceae archaeon]